MIRLATRETVERASVILLMTSGSLHAQETVVPEWTRLVAGPNADRVQPVAVGDGGIFVAGNAFGICAPETETDDHVFLRRLDLDGDEVWRRRFDAGSAEGLAYHGGSVYLVGRDGTNNYVRRFSADGDPLWSVLIPNHVFVNLDGHASIAADADGVFVAGQTTALIPGEIGFGGRDAYVLRMDHGGNPVWVEQFGTGGDDFALDLSVFGGRVYVVGTTSGEFPGEMDEEEGHDVFLSAFSVSGAGLWTRQFGFNNFDYGNTVFADSTGVYLGGFYVGNAGRTFPCGCFSFLRRYETDGTFDWEVRAPVSGTPGAVGIDAPSIEELVGDDSGLYVLGEGFRAARQDIWVRKYTRDGVAVWTEKFGGLEDSDTAGSIAILPGGDLVVVGSTNGDFLGEANQGCLDGFALRLTPDSDGDGLSDKAEAELGTDPLDPDTDADGIGDLDEVELGTDPLDGDSDDDGLTDGEEIELGTDPLDADTDADGIPDGSDPSLVAQLVLGIPESVWKGAGNQGAALGLLEDAEHLIAKGNLAAGAGKLETLLRRTDGCPSSPDGNDWVLSCFEQSRLQELIVLLLDNLEG